MRATEEEIKKLESILEKVTPHIPTSFLEYYDIKPILTILKYSQFVEDWHDAIAITGVLQVRKPFKKTETCNVVFAYIFPDGSWDFYPNLKSTPTTPRDMFHQLLVEKFSLRHEVEQWYVSSNLYI